jgi:hypothetical protein
LRAAFLPSRAMRGEAAAPSVGPISRKLWSGARFEFRFGLAPAAEPSLRR